MMKKYDAIVVGAGVGGLAAANKLAKDGLHTLLLEKHNIPGGAVTTFRRGRFEFEAGPHYFSHYGTKETPQTMYKILEEFGLYDSRSIIVNGHVPVEQKKGESPIKCGGKLLVIDGGFSKAYQEKTGIAGYTLVSNSRGMRLVEHEMFESKEAAIIKESDIISESMILETAQHRVRVADTDIGKELRESIRNLEMLLQAYQDGTLIEKVK